MRFGRARVCPAQVAFDKEHRKEVGISIGERRPADVSLGISTRVVQIGNQPVQGIRALC